MREHTWNGKTEDRSCGRNCPSSTWRMKSKLCQPVADHHAKRSPSCRARIRQLTWSQWRYRFLPNHSTLKPITFFRKEANSIHSAYQMYRNKDFYTSLPWMPLFRECSGPEAVSNNSIYESTWERLRANMSEPNCDGSLSISNDGYVCTLVS